jgi:hypothetical protein
MCRETELSKTPSEAGVARYNGAVGGGLIEREQVACPK